MDEQFIEMPNRDGTKTKSTGISTWGGKFNAIPLLVPYFPRPISTLKFVDVFTGSGVVSLNYWPRNCVMNDKNDYIFAFFFVLNGVSFKDLIDEFPDSEDIKYYKRRYEMYKSFMVELKGMARGLVWFEEYRKRTDLVGKALTYLILNRSNFAGKVKINDKNPFRFKIPERTPLVAFEEMVKFFQERDVRVWNFDFREVIQRANKWNDTDQQVVFIYCDPPYIEAGKGLYEYDFTEKDLTDLRDLLAESSHHWIMSNENSTLVRKLFKDYYFKKVRWQYTGTNAGDTTRFKGKYEFLVSNRPFVKREKEVDNMESLGKWM